VGVKHTDVHNNKIQFDKCLAKTLVLEAERCEIAVTKKVVRKKMTSAELDQEFRELNAAQMKANTREAVDQIIGEKGSGKKETEKSGMPGLRMMKAEEETGEGSRLPPVSANFGAKTRGAGGVENVQSKTEKRGKKIQSIPTPVIEEMELESEGEEVDFEGEQRDEVGVEIPQDILKMVVHSVLGDQEKKGGGPVGALSSAFLQSLVSDRMDIDLGEECEKKIHEIVQDLEASGREVGLDG